jgi:LacI family transcriptional regulator, fructose operon transcriptional repressor
VDDKHVKSPVVGVKDVARVAGVAPATVSRALGKGPVSAELRARVEEAVRKTGYRPNLSARRLRSQTSGTLGLIVADIRNPFFTALARAVEDAAYAAGMRVLLCNTSEDPEREAMYLRLMEEERVAGIVLAPTAKGHETLRRSRFLTPVVLVDRPGPAGLYDSVVLDNRRAGAALVDHLAARGRQRIFGVFPDTSTGLERREGCAAAAATHPVAFESAMVAPTVEASADLVHRQLSGPARPDGLVLGSGLLLMGAVRCLRRLALSWPRDVALVGFDNELWTELVEPGLTVIEQPVEDMGRTAVGLLLERMRSPLAATRMMVLSGRRIDRGSS